MEKRTTLKSQVSRVFAQRPGTIRFFFLLALLAVVSAGIIVFSEPLGGNISPKRLVQDPYPVFYDVAVDSQNDLVVASDTNRFSLRTYERTVLSQTVVEPQTIISGTNTGLDFACGVDLDPVSREIYAVNNDTGADLMVFDYEAQGDVEPVRLLHPAARGAWGVSIDRLHDEVAVTVEHVNKLVVYHRTAQGDDEPLRVIQGPNTQLTDPHGVFLDGKNDEIFVANHDSWHSVGTGEIDPYSIQAGDPGSGNVQESSSAFISTGRFNAFSITVHSRTATGDAAPLRVIQGPQTQLRLPMKLHVDTVHNEIAVANSGDDSILIFPRLAAGNAVPVRRIKGSFTELNNPTGVYIDSKNDEIWVASPGSHSLSVFERTANGNVAPLRVIRSAPAEAASVGLGNPGGVTYDPMRKQILVPN